MAEPPDPTPGPPDKRVVIKGASARPSAMHDRGTTGQTPGAQGGIGPRGRTSAVVNALLLTGIGGAIVALIPLLPWWKIGAEPPEGPAPTELASFATVRGVQAWPGFVMVIVGAIIMISVVVASKPDATDDLRSKLGAVVIGSGIVAFILTMIALASGPDLSDGVGLSATRALFAFLPIVGALAACVGGVLLIKASGD